MALDRLTKVDGGGISTTSDYRVGIITASKFVGPIEGTITSADATFTGNVSIAGTLTYEDVTNVDSVGLITARDGIFLPDSKMAKFGNTAADPDLQIYHGGTASYISHSGTGNLFIHSNTVAIRKQNQQAYFVGVNGQSKLYEGGSERLVTTDKGITVGTGVTIETNGQTYSTGISTTTENFYIKPDTQQNRGIYIGSNGQLRLQYTGGANQAYLRSSAAFLSIASNNVFIQRYDTNYTMASFRAGQQCKLTYNYVDRIATSGIGATVYGQLDTTDLDVDGHTNLDNVSIAGITTFSDDVKFTGNNYNVLWDKSDDSLKFDALAKIKLNNSFQFYHNTNGVIHNTSGITFIYGSGSGNISIQAQSGYQNIACSPNGGTSLYYQGNQKLYTVSDGVYINDNLGIQDSIQHILDTNTKIRFPADDTITFETAGSERLRIFSDGSITQNYGNPNASAVFRISKSGGGAAELRFDNASANTANLYLGDDEQLRIRYGSTEHTRFTSTGRVGIGTVLPVEKFEVNGSINAGGDNSPVFNIRNEQGDYIRAFKHYFDVGKGNIAGNASNRVLVNITIDESFHQAGFEITYFTRLQAVSDGHVRPNKIIFGVNRFNSAGSQNITKTVVEQHSEAANHCDVNIVSVSGTNYQIQMQFGTQPNVSSGAGGWVEGATVLGARFADVDYYYGART